MEKIIFAGVAALVIACWKLLVKSAKRERPESGAAWQTAARQLSLECRWLLSGQQEISGDLNGVHLLMQVVDRGAFHTRIAAPWDVLPKDLEISADTGWEHVNRLAVRDLRIGDPAFDARVVLRGPEALLVGRLGAEGRRRILELIIEGGGVRDGAVFLEVPGILGEAPGIVRRMDLVALATRALTGAGVPLQAALAANAATDPVPAVRLRSLDVLLRHFPNSPEARAAAGAALDDADVELRLRASLAVPAERATAALVPMVTDRVVAPSLRARAFGALSQKLPYASYSGILAGVLESGDDELRIAIVREIAAARDASQAAHVARLLEGASDALAEAIAEVLGSLQGPGVEAPLLRLLRHPAANVRQAAVIALGRTGSIAAIEPLLPLTKGLLANSGLKQTALDAVRAIQSRLGDADAGRLSVVDGEQIGALSVATPSGAVSFAEPADTVKPRD